MSADKVMIKMGHKGEEKYRSIKYSKISHKPLGLKCFHLVFLIPNVVKILLNI